MAGSGKNDRAASDGAQQHQINLEAYYRYRKPTLTPGDFRFELALVRPGLAPFSLQHMISALSWDDEQSALTGSITANRPVAGDFAQLPISRGDLVRCRVKWDGKTYQLWEMRCEAPQIEKEIETVTVALTDDLALLKQGTQDFIFRKTKARKFGYTAAQITRIVAHRMGLEVGELAHCEHRFALVKRKVTPYAAITAAWQEERHNSGRKFIIRLRNGKLEVVTPRRNSLIYVLANEIQTAAITTKAGAKVPPTVLVGTAKLHKGKDSKKISYTHVERAIVAKLGHVRREKDYGSVSSHAELRRSVKRDYALGLRVNDVITVQHQGIPFILRGDGARILLPAEGYKGANSFVYARRANHTVAAGTYTTQWDFVLTDPYGGKP